MDAVEEIESRTRAFDRVVLERDEAGAIAVLDDDYALVLVHPVPSRVDRARWLEMLPQYVVDDWVVEEQQIDVLADVAAVLRRVRMKATVLGEERSGLFFLTDVWRRVDGTWRVWRRHSSPVSAGTIG